MSTLINRLEAPRYINAPRRLGPDYGLAPKSPVTFVKVAFAVAIVGLMIFAAEAWSPSTSNMASPFVGTQMAPHPHR